MWWRMTLEFVWCVWDNFVTVWARKRFLVPGTANVQDSKSIFGALAATSEAEC